MNIAIIFAMSDELDAALNLFNQDEITDCSINPTRQIYLIKYKSHNLYLSLSGIGKVNAAINTQYLIDKFEINYVINLGVAGGLSDELNFGDVVIATDLVYHDVDVTAFDLPLGQIPRMPSLTFPCDIDIIDKIKFSLQNQYNLSFGCIASGDQFINDEKKARLIATTFTALACEMEGAAIAHTSFVNNLKCLVVRSLSDKAGIDQNGAHTYHELLQMASNSVAKLFIPILEIVIEHA